MADLFLSSDPNQSGIKGSTTIKTYNDAVTSALITQSYTKGSTDEVDKVLQ